VATSQTGPQGSFSAGTPGNYIWFVQIVPTYSGTVQNISVAFNTSNGSTHFTLGIFSDSGGSPHTLLGTTASHLGYSSGVNTLVVISPPTIVSATNYWMAETDDAGATFAQNTTSPNQGYEAQSYAALPGTAAYTAGASGRNIWFQIDNGGAVANIAGFFFGI